MANKYPVKWRGETYYASDLTDALKFKFCQWVYAKTLANAKRYKTGREFLEFDRKFTAEPPEWTSYPDPTVLECLNKKDGMEQLMRLILNLDHDAMSDEDFQDFLKDKEAEGDMSDWQIASNGVVKQIELDYQIAMRRINEDADPKAKTGGHGSPRPEDEKEPTLSSATSQ